MKDLDQLSPEELGMLFPIMLTEHDPEWGKLFSDERKRLQLAVGNDVAVSIGHIGSTAVPGLLSKPSIDILMEIDHEADLSELIRSLSGLGYHHIHRPDNPAPHKMFVKGYTKAGFRGQVFHIHVRYPGKWDEYSFLEYLTRHPEAVDAYGNLKKELSVKYRNDREGYTVAKTRFINGIVKLAKGGFRNIMFDLDGTLTDPKEGIVKSILHAVGELGIFENNPLELDAFIGPPLAESFRERYGLSEEMTTKAIRVYRDYFSAKGKYENQIYPGIREMLYALVSAGMRLFIATSKPTIFASQIAGYFNIEEVFTDIVGCNLDNTRNEKAEVIQYILDHHHLDPAETLMIGDRKHDLIGARICGVASLAVAYGYGSRAELEGYDTLLIAGDVEALHSLLVHSGQSAS